MSIVRFPASLFCFDSDHKSWWDDRLGLCLRYDSTENFNYICDEGDYFNEEENLCVGKNLRSKPPLIECDEKLFKKYYALPNEDECYRFVGYPYTSELCEPGFKLYTNLGVPFKANVCVKVEYTFPRYIPGNTPKLYGVSTNNILSINPITDDNISISDEDNSSHVTDHFFKENSRHDHVIISPQDELDNKKTLNKTPNIYECPKGGKLIKMKVKSLLKHLNDGFSHEELEPFRHLLESKRNLTELRVCKNRLIHAPIRSDDCKKDGYWNNVELELCIKLELGSIQKKCEIEEAIMDEEDDYCLSNKYLPYIDCTVYGNIDDEVNYILNNNYVENEKKKPKLWSPETNGVSLGYVSREYRKNCIVFEAAAPIIDCRMISSSLNPNLVLNEETNEYMCEVDTGDLYPAGANYLSKREELEAKRLSKGLTGWEAAAGLQEGLAAHEGYISNPPYHRKKVMKASRNKLDQVTAGRGI